MSKKQRRALQEAVAALRPRVTRLSDWRSVTVAGDVGVWDKEKVIRGLEHVNRYTNSYASDEAVAQAQTLFVQITAAVEAMEKPFAS